MVIPNRKIIIKNETKQDMSDILFYVYTVINNNKISDGKSYNCITQFDNGIAVIVIKNRASDTFIVWENLDNSYGEVKEKNGVGNI